ncbi:MAG: hypothetical protein ACOCP8_08720 [archaeon]
MDEKTRKNIKENINKNIKKIQSLKNHALIIGIISAVFSVFLFLFVSFIFSLIMVIGIFLGTYSYIKFDKEEDNEKFKLKGIKEGYIQEDGTIDTSHSKIKEYISIGFLNPVMLENGEETVKLSKKGKEIIY